MAKIKIGTVGYLNSHPLTAYIDRDRYEVIADYPRAIAKMLADGEVDVALAPVAAVLTDASYLMIPEFCIGAEGPVASVLLLGETPPEEWTEVVLDGESRTSVTLSRLLLTKGPLSKRVRDDLVIREVGPGEALEAIGGTVAGLVIGDAARELPDRITVRLDLAEEWLAWTGKPFVFAVWAGRPDLPQQVRDDLRAAGRVGMAKVGEEFSGDDLVYLTQRIRHNFDERALMGLRWYASLAFREGLIGTEHVAFYAPEAPVQPITPAMDDLLVTAADGGRLSREEVRALFTEATFADLGVAARSRAIDLHDSEHATYLCGIQVSEEQTHAGGQALLEAIESLSGEGITSVALDGVETLPREAQLERLRLAAGLGLQVQGWPAAGLVGMDDQELEGWIEALRSSGLSSVSVDFTEHGLSWPVLARLHAADIAVDAVYVIKKDQGSEAFLEHMEQLRSAQDATGAISSLTMSIELPEGVLVQPDSPTTAYWMRCMATARLFLDNIEHLSTRPSQVGVDMAQTALFVGADDLGVIGVSTESKGFQARVSDGERAIRVSGLSPQRRDLHFRPLGGPVTKARRVRPIEDRARL